MVYTLRFLSPLAGSIALLALFACGKIDTPKLVDPYGNLTGKSLGFDSEPPFFENDASGNQIGLESATRGACGNILLQWNPATDAVSGSNIIYYIYQATASGKEDFNSPPTYQTTQFYLTAGTLIPYLVKNLSPKTKYYFVVRAVDEAGNLSVIDPNSLVERSETTFGTRGNGPDPNLYCPGGYAGDTVVLTGPSVAGSTTASFTPSSSPVSVPVTPVSNSEVRAIIPANIQTDRIQVNSPGGSTTTADSFLFFPPGQNISNNAGFSSEPAIAVSGSTIGMVWTDSYDGTGSGGGVILFSYSTDGGQTFSTPPLPLSDPARISSTPHLSFGTGSPPAVYFVWTDSDSTSNKSDIYFTSSPTGFLTSTSFTSTVNLSTNAGASLHASLHPRVTSSGSSVSVVWDDQSASNGEIFYIQSSDGGLTFGAPPTTLSSASASGHQAERPELVQSGVNLTIAWKETQSGIHVIQSSDGGANFSPAVISPFGSSADPRGQKMTLDGGGNIYMVWEDTFLSPAQISMVKFPVNSLPDFNTSVPLSDSGNASNPSITAVGNQVIAAWVDLTQQKFDNNRLQNEIFLISSPDGGLSFTPPVNFSSPFLDSSKNPMLVNDGISSTIFMAWQQVVPPTASLEEKTEVFFSHF